MSPINSINTSVVFRVFITFLGIAFILGCAQQRPLTGGAKDTQGPVIKASSPINYTKNFTGHTIAFEFDEYVQVKSLSSELVVSPPLNKTPTYAIKGKKLTITIEDTLLPNTTYNFNFGEAIVDLNEGNVLDSNLLVFSTGNDIDSGSISGIVIESFSGKPQKGATVMLFSSLQDTITKGNPMYVTKTDGSGNFELKYLKDMDYQIVATEFTGAKFSLVPFENVAFYPKELNAHEHSPVELSLFKEPDTTQYLSRELAKDYYSFIVGYHADLANPVFDFTPMTDTFDYYIEELAADSFKFWISNDIDLDSVILYVKDDLTVDDTVVFDLPSRFDFYKKLRKKDKEIAKTAFKLSASTHHYFDTLFLKYNRPVQEFQTDSMMFCNDGDTIPFTTMMNNGKLKLLLNPSSTGTSKSLRSTAIIYNWQPKSKYGIILYPGATKDVLGLTNDTIILNANTKEFEDYGSFRLMVNVEGYTQPLIMELLDDKGNAFKTYYSNNGSYNIYEPLFVPGKFQIRLTLDTNGNKIWDTGNLMKKTLPERTIYYNGTVEIRPNWDMEETWNITLD